MLPVMHGILPNLRAINKLMQNQEATMSKVPQPKSSACHPAPVKVSRPCLLVQLLLPREADQNQTKCSPAPFPQFQITLSSAKWQSLYLLWCSTHKKSVCQPNDKFQHALLLDHAEEKIWWTDLNQLMTTSDISRVEFKSWNIQIPKEKEIILRT